MTNTSEIMELQSMLKVKSSYSSTATMNSTQQLSTESINRNSTNTMIICTNNTSLSSLTDDGLDMNYDPKFITQIPITIVTLKDKLNFKRGRSAHVARALIYESDILKVRKMNHMSTNKGKEAKAKIEKAKKTLRNV